MPKNKPHVEWPVVNRRQDGFVDTDVLTLCDRPNSKERVDLLKADTVKHLGEDLFVRADGSVVKKDDVCRNCTKKLDKLVAQARAAA